MPVLRSKRSLQRAIFCRRTASKSLIKVVISGSNPKDWKVPEYAAEYPNDNDGTYLAKAKVGINQSDDIAGVVEAVGKDVIEFKVCIDFDAFL
jgi:NADPH:quinone reductase-like Zn-dependent oxidoreductase